MSPSVFVAGHRGMLGHVVARLLEESGFRIITTDARYEGHAGDALIAAARSSDARYVVNCIGRIWQKSTDPTELFRANALLPIHLAQSLRPDQHLFHASTDCVFAGDRGAYAVSEIPDADDEYGVSKQLGEGVRHWPNASVLRVSIVGLDLGGGHGLLAWFLSQPEDKPVRGYVNHFWNGITTLEWARILVERINRLEGGEANVPLSQPGTERVDKYTLLCLFREAFGTRHEIIPVEASPSIDRTLVPTETRAPIAEQLAMLSRWAHGDAGAARGAPPLAAARR
ncbi:MAG: sugar nucleotide-binding protein [Gemmatimonadaceae bacterium]|nr:sugar nucleotide-binding protein [Gemmatimonadaceae bacterium]NUQ93632.1 sugar nucleotide-binding protein [Gemmatimonadaceae bacterium]NUR17927.1 sugar nucleotide-binding protein [Gemmatimonadaceae bacterium]NUS98964.1 sugar nucleotide-binding protein [Gemmatimonadaceae bacterium]